MKDLLLKTIFLCLLIFLLGTSLTHAQLIDSRATLYVTPRHPQPFSDVTLHISSSVIDVQNSLIIWEVEGKEEARGVGKDEFKLTVGEMGTSTHIRASIATQLGDVIVKEITLRPSSVDLLWQAADSYVPPFYRGRSLPSDEGRIRVVAIPQIKVKGEIKSPRAFIYSWSRDFKEISAASGFSKNTLEFKHTSLEEAENISVEVASLDGGITGSGIAPISPTTPKILFYEDDPLEGVRYERALNAISGGFRMDRDVVEIVAAPYFFSPADPQSTTLRYEWKINEEEISPGERNNRLVLRRGETGGIVTLSLLIESIPKLFQTDRASLNIRL